MKYQIKVYNKQGKLLETLPTIYDNYQRALNMCNIYNRLYEKKIHIPHEVGKK